MREKAVVFPGQGCQRPGMGRDFYDEIPESRQTYEEAADVLGWDVSAVCFAEADERLNMTEYTQPCLLTTEIAMLRGLAGRFGFSPTIFGGHSLGELTALVAAGVLPFGAALKIVQRRGQLMQSAVPVGAGAMTALIADDLNPDKVAGQIVDLAVDIANINSKRQIVLSGETRAVDQAEARLKEVLEGVRFVRLNVSAPFHSRFLAVIESPFRGCLDEEGRDLDSKKAVTVTSNYLGGFHRGERNSVIEALVLQLSHTVQWVRNMEAIVARTDDIWEVGPGRPLRDFFGTLGVACTSITTLGAARKAFASCQPGNVQ